MDSADLPLLVLVTGMPGAGKTTLATALGDELHWPVIAKDAIKERLFDELGGELVTIDTATPIDLAGLIERARTLSV